MAYVYDNKTYRNLQQQVKENMDDIARLQNLKLVGLDVSYIVDTEEDLAEITAEQGMVVAVGTEQPYTLFVYNDSSWVDFGEFPKAGPQGEQGPQGQVGNPGPRGLTGEPGPRGYTGAAGPAGQPGPQGARGPQGPAGPKGDRGLVDAYAANAESITAVGQAYVDENGYLQVCTSLSPLTFEQGASVKGPKGDTGEQGPQGIQGEQGAQGPTGATGPKGARGPQGEQGIRGPQGEQGIQGPQGPTGATGPEGPQGPKGDTGAQGPTGPTGPQGPKGDPGLTASVEVNGQVYTTDSTGKITLPDYPADVAWGNITGTLSSQTDLQSALNAKADVSAIPTNYVTTNTKQTISGQKTFSGSLSATNSAYFSGSILKTSDTTDLEVEKTLVHAGWPIQDGRSSDYKATYFSNGVYIEDFEEEDEDAPYYLAFPASDGILAVKTDIGNATLTIQKNGTNVGTFTANATTNKTINITVPTNYVTTDTQQNITASKTIYGDLTITDDDDKTIELIANQTGGLRIEIDDEYETSILGAGELTLKNENGWGPTIDVATGQQANTTLTLPSSTGTLALTSDIPTVPTNVSAFTNDAGYITSSAIPTNVSAFTNDSGYITSSALSNYLQQNTFKTINWSRTDTSSSDYDHRLKVEWDPTGIEYKITLDKHYTGSGFDLASESLAITEDEIKFTNGLNQVTTLSPMGLSVQDSTTITSLWADRINYTDSGNLVSIYYNDIATKSNSETWTFTLSDNTTVTKTVVLG